MSRPARLPFAPVLATVLAALCLTACGGGDPDDDVAPPPDVPTPNVRCTPTHPEACK